MNKKSLQQIRVSLVKEGTATYQITQSTDIANVIRRNIIRDDPREMFIALYLNTRHKLIGTHIVSIGTISNSSVHPREVFAPGIVMSVYSLVVAHNHPSGDCKPSPEDQQITDRLREAGELLGIPMLDHIIIGDNEHYSFASQQVIKEN